MSKSVYIGILIEFFKLFITIFKSNTNQNIHIIKKNMDIITIAHT